MASLGHVRGGEVGSPVSGGGAEDGLEAFFNTLDDLVFVLDAEGRILFTNPTAQKRLGYAPEQLAGMYLVYVHPPERRSEAAAALADLPVDTTILYRIPLVARDGDLIAAEIRFTRGAWAGQPALVGLARDITERQLTEAALRESQERYRALFERSLDFLFISDLDGNFLDANDAALALLGYERKDIPALSYRSLVSPDHLASALRALEEVRTTGTQQIPCEYRLRRKDGTLVEVESKASLIFHQGKPFAIQGIARDITSRKATEREIQRRNRELTLLNRVMEAAVAELEPAAVLDVACRELSLTFDLPQASAWLLDPARASLTIVSDYAAPGRPPVLQTTVHLNGDPRLKLLVELKQPLVAEDVPNDPRLAPLRELLQSRQIVSLLGLPLVIDAQVAGCLVLSTTGPRRFSKEEINLAWNIAGEGAGALARAHLSETRRRLMAAIEQTPESILITDTRGQILYVNPAFERVAGYTRAEAIGQNVRLVRSGRHDAGFYLELWQRISAGQVWQGRFINARKDGSHYTEDAVIAPVRDEQGVIVNYIAVKRDITHELEMEERFRQTQKMDMIGRLAGGVAHDFNNILTAIFGNTDLALLDLPVGHVARPSIEEIRQAAERAAGLTRQLLAFARRQMIEPRVLDVNELIVNLNRMLNRLIGEDIELVTRAAPEVAPIKADAGQLEQVVLNLVVNARDAMPEGGTLTLGTANVTLDDAYALAHPNVTAGDYVLVSVTDTGTGMTDEVKQHIFEPFFTTKEQGKGTGLGLATCFGIIQQSQGHIEFESQPGQGTTFRVYLPRLRESAVASSSRPFASSLPRGTETLLLVEDDLMLRRLMSRVLRNLGYTVLEAGNGQEALGLARAQGSGFHLLLTDVVMPAMNGKTLADQVGSLYPGARVMFMSGYVSNEIVREAMTKPGAFYLQKPFTLPELTAKVREALASS